MYVLTTSSINSVDGNGMQCCLHYMWLIDMTLMICDFLRRNRYRDCSSDFMIFQFSAMILVCMVFDNFWRQKKSNLMKKKINLRCVWFLIFFDDFCYSYCWSILHASWCYPTTVWWLEKVYKSNFTEESFRRSRNWLFFISTALGRTLLSNWKDSTHKTLYIIVC